VINDIKVYAIVRERQTCAKTKHTFNYFEYESN